MYLLSIQRQTYSVEVYKKFIEKIKENVNVEILV